MLEAERRDDGGTRNDESRAEARAEGEPNAIKAHACVLVPYHTGAVITFLEPYFFSARQADVRENRRMVLAARRRRAGAQKCTLPGPRVNRLRRSGRTVLCPRSTAAIALARFTKKKKKKQ